MTSSSPTNRWRAFALLAVAFFMTTIDLTIVNTSLPTIGRDLHFAETSLLWVVTAYELARAPEFRRLLDGYERRAPLMEPVRYAGWLYRLGYVRQHVRVAVRVVRGGLAPVEGAQSRVLERVQP